MDKLRARLGGREEGFTLIELMVVVLIIAILIAIAIPTFLGARNRAQDKQAQSNLRNALVTEDEYYTDNQAYSEDGAAGGALEGLEPQLNWQDTDASAAGVTATLGATDQIVVLESDSKSDTTFCLAKVASGGGAGAFYAKVATAAAACPTDPADAAYQPTADGWK